MYKCNYRQEFLTIDKIWCVVQ